ncbi:MAG: polysaccharide deacetylase [Bacillota bacterium]|nr:polysaccharide deacetylase [Bacillota bacterium]
MSQYNNRRSRRRPNARSLWSVPFLAGTLIVLCVAAGILFFVKKNDSVLGGKIEKETGAAESAFSGESGATGESGEDVSAENAATADANDLESVLAAADRKAKMYDYDGAIADLKASAFADDEQVTKAMEGYEQTKSTLVRQDTSKVTHVFFHTLVVDSSKAFDGDSREAGYNQVMTTIPEFEKILQQMYDRGFVLVRLHDVAYEEKQADGSVKMKPGDIMLPEGKKAFVMSQDDVCYYEYMTGDGFATKMVIDENGKPKCEYQKDDGTVEVGDYDLVPILDRFIEEHPDFSYRGAKACLAFTGYNGVLGYRTDDAYLTNEKFLAAHPDFDMEKEKQSVRDVAECLRKDGYELASHTWGHRNVGAISLADLQTDTDKWANRVESLIGKSDIILFPFGADIADWHPYNTADERYQILYKAGFRYICNVDSNQYFVQYGDDYFRQGRRNLDGYRMYYDLPESNPTKSHLDDLFDVNEVFDRSRPTPVPPMGHETKGVGNVTAGH